MAKSKYPAKDGHKVCNVCLKELPLSEFYFKKQGRFQYYDPKCSACARTYSKKWYEGHRQQSYAHHRNWNNKNPERVDFLMWRSHVQRKYGLSKEKAAEIFSNQNCHICGTNDPRNGDKRMCVDHDHKTGKLRGLLCHACNRAVERIDKFPDWCEKALAYLAKANAQPSANTPRT